MPPAVHSSADQARWPRTSVGAGRVETDAQPGGERHQLHQAGQLIGRHVLLIRHGHTLSGGRPGQHARPPVRQPGQRRGSRARWPVRRAVTLPAPVTAARNTPPPATVFVYEMSSAENITKCITCGAELHPERAKKYNYCMKPDCQAKNLKGLTMVAVGVNKSAEQFMLLDEDTKTELAEGKYHDQRRGSFGVPTSAPAAASSGEPATPAQPAPSPNAGRACPSGLARPRPRQARIPAARSRRRPPRPLRPGRGPSASRASPGPRPSAGWPCCTTSRGSGPTRSPGSWA